MELTDAANMILGALSMGALAAVKDTATQSVKDAYSGLKEAVARRVQGDPDDEMVLRKFERDPKTWEAPLQQVLLDRAVVNDADVLSLARQLRELVAPQQVARVIHHTNIESAGVVNQGDNATINQSYTAPPRRDKRS